MAEPTQYSFDLTEVTKALVKQQGLTSGKWTLAIEFNFSAMMAGPSPNEMKPTALIAIQRLQLVAAGAQTVPGSPIVDASKMIPSKKSKKA